MWDEFSGQLKEQFDLPEFPLLYTSSLLCRLINGWSFGEASPLNQVKKCRYPMFFIHGDSDTFVPTEMVYQLYEALQTKKYGLQKVLNMHFRILRTGKNTSAVSNNSSNERQEHHRDPLIE